MPIDINQNYIDTTEKWKSVARAASDWKNELIRELGFDAGTLAKEFTSIASGEKCNSHYKHLDDRAYKIVCNIKEREGVEVAKLFLQLVIAEALEMTAIKRKQNQLPYTLNSNQLRHFLRIINKENLADSWLDIDADLFMKEYGLASERLYAAGAQLLDRRCGVPRSVIFKEGVTKAPAKLMFFAKLAGFKPMIQIHTHTFNLDRFNPEGWDECYRGCVELYRIFPELLGVFGSSWFYDPTIVKISPRLQYLQSIPQASGAALFYYSTDSSAIANATSSSHSRRKLYEEGLYLPKNYMMIWSKKIPN